MLTGRGYSRVGLDSQEDTGWRREVVQKYELPQLHVQTGHCGFFVVVLRGKRNPELHFMKCTSAVFQYPSISGILYDLLSAYIGAVAEESGHEIKCKNSSYKNHSL